MAISFKDVGVQAELRRTVLQRNRSLRPIGIKTPVEIDYSGEEVFKMNFTLPEQISDNLRNLLLTNHGERLALTNFGANLRPLLSEYSNKESFDAEAMIRINTAVQRWMPFVNLLEFDSIPDFINNRVTGRIRLIITYSVPSLRVERQTLELELFVL